MRRLMLALVVVLAACGGASPTTAPATPSPTATATPSPTATATPSPTATATPTEEPAASVPLPVPVRVTKITETVAVGDPASITVFTLKGANCSIEVLYDSGVSTAKGLDPTDADANGIATWSWTVGSKTSPQTVPLTVTCSVPGRTGQVSAEVTVK